MPALQGGTDEEIYEAFLDNVVAEGRFDSKSEALEFCVQYTLYNRYDIDV